MHDAEDVEASGSDTVEPAVTRATQALGLSSQLCSIRLLIAESWLERGRGLGLRALLSGGGRREEERDEAGSWRWLLIRE